MMGPTVNTLKIKIKKKRKKKTEICVTQSAAAEYSPLKILKIQNEGGGGGVTVPNHWQPSRAS